MRYYLLLFFLIPVVLNAVFRFRVYKLFYKNAGIFYASIIFFCIGFASLIFAPLFMQNEKTQVDAAHQNQKALCFVFDISNSMNEKDCYTDTDAGKKTRLEASVLLAQNLLDDIEYMDIPVSAVITKGDAFTTVPLTYDMSALRILLASISSEMLSARGSNIAEGINAGSKLLYTFAQKSGKELQTVIAIFTDGEETHGDMNDAALNAKKNGQTLFFLIPNITLEATTQNNMAENADVYMLGSSTAQEENARIAIRSMLQGNAKAPDVMQNISMQGMSIENFPIQFFLDAHTSIAKETLLLLCAVIFLSLSLLILRFPQKQKNTYPLVFLAVFFPLIVSCSKNNQDIFEIPRFEILKGVYTLVQKNYAASDAHFLRSQDKTYAQYNLALSFYEQEENEASLNVLEKILQQNDSNDGTHDGGVPSAVVFASYYTQGLIYYNMEDYESAARCFIDALKINGNDLDAKTNLEITLFTQAENETQDVMRQNRNSGTNTDSENNAAPDTISGSVFSFIESKSKPRITAADASAQANNDIEDL